ncbi:hypothetical protein L3I75_004651 [Vibrio vulnificus]|uniref:hypothetical protein n=1 Tax=Vibrio vulnificus TaxID=672 RepID=UPI001A3374A2|nr:hypothetical protein [Vibrio vulnificus]EIU7865422.1 hypothetical protein [Vibrio vulnificus]EJE8581691.1 hypothetical protein [Vibrio vulnificus]HAS6396325.1 hypothetical protein [Vibrio vulnificus]
MSFITTVRQFLSQDPKPVFDHIRNVGISTAIILGASILYSKKGTVGEQDLTGFYVLVSILLATGSFLFLLNMNHATRTISTSILGRQIGLKERLSIIKRIYKARKKVKLSTYKKIRDFYFKEWLAQFVAMFYYLVIGAVVFSYVLSSGVLDFSTKTQESVLYMNVEKITETIKDKQQEISTLSDEVVKLQAELDALKSAPETKI